MSKQKLKYEIQLDRLQNIALSGISRALIFAKFAETGSYYLEKVNAPQSAEAKGVSSDFVPPINTDDFLIWEDNFVSWNFCNAVNEIIESFFVFLEMLYFALDTDGKSRQVNTDDVLRDVIRNWQNEIRYGSKGIRNKSKLDALSEQGLIFSDDEKKIIESFWEIRNLISHNLGIADNRKKLCVNQKKIILKWYYREIVAVLKNGEVRPLELGSTLMETYPDLTEDLIGNSYDVALRTKRIKFKEIKIGDRISFDLDEVQQIAWTFFLLVYDASEKIKEIFLKRAGKCALQSL